MVHYLYCIACWISSRQLALAELPRLKAIHQGRRYSDEKKAKFDPGATKRRFTFSVGWYPFLPPCSAVQKPTLWSGNYKFIGNSAFHCKMNCAKNSETMRRQFSPISRVEKLRRLQIKHGQKKGITHAHTENLLFLKILSYVLSKYGMARWFFLDLSPPIYWLGQSRGNGAATGKETMLAGEKARQLKLFFSKTLDWEARAWDER